ncbi:MAG: Fur family transcriptional regulator [Pseudomonadota bacterium]
MIEESEGEPPKAFEPHDHATCAAFALEAATAACAERGLRLTPVRQRTLEILLESHQALGAYEILSRLGKDGLGSQPPVVYRALDFLVSNGFVHKIERLNAFVACVDPAAHGSDAPTAFLICSDCGTVGETVAQDVASSLGAAAERAGFTVKDAKVEVEGICPDCRKSAE